MSRRMLIPLFLFVCSLLSYGSAASAAPLTPVAPQKVCMVNNMLFPNDQIPVSVAGKTYYGCCAMCKKTLAEDPAARTAIDPVTRESVDKADAVIAADANGKVFYFKSQDALQKYNARK